MHAFTDGEVRVVGTCKVHLTGKLNQIEIAQSVERAKIRERGSWELIAAVDVPSKWSNAQAAHNRAQQKLPLPIERRTFQRRIRRVPG